MWLALPAGSAGNDPVLDYIAGCIAGSANITSGFPFDTVKVRLQAAHSAYRGPWQAFTTILRQEGVREGGRVLQCCFASSYRCCPFVDFIAQGRETSRAVPAVSVALTRAARCVACRYGGCTAGSRRR